MVGKGVDLQVEVLLSGAGTRVGAGTLSGGQVMVMGWVGALVAARRACTHGRP